MPNGTLTLCAAAVAALVAPLPARYPAGRVAPAAAMRVARASHTATALPDGRVFVAGGFGGSGGESIAFETTELYDPATSSFAPGPSLRQARSGHSATALRDGRVLIVGGWTGRYQATRGAELFDPRTNRVTHAGEMREARADQTATLLADGRVLIVGGYDPRFSAIASAELYDPATNRFTPTGALAAPRAAHTATLLADGRVLIAGGGAGRGDARTLHVTAEIYDPARGTFARSARMVTPRHKHAAARLPDGSVLIVGGSDARDWRGRLTSAERFDPATGRFVAAGSAALSRFKLPNAVLTLRDGRVLVAGGGDRAEVYDSARGSFAAATGSLGAARFYSVAALLPNGAVLVTGGYHEAGGSLPATDRAYVYTP